MRPVPALAACLCLGMLLAGCASRAPATSEEPTSEQPGQRGGFSGVYADSHVPPFASLPYEPISRRAVADIALREWRLFGQLVDDDPPGTRPPPLPEDKPERWSGLWQRVGEYWWIGLDPGTREAAWTGKHNARGVEFGASADGRYAWSAAFISYVMRVAGAGSRFPYAPSHADYINAAREQSLEQATFWVVSAERPESYAPRPGDLICMGRGRSATLRYDDLPSASSFPGHCDIVVQARPNEIAVVGGNVDDAVTMKHIPVSPTGTLAGPDGIILDSRYPWMVVLRLLEAGPVS